MNDLLWIGGAIALFFILEKSTVVNSLRFLPNGISFDVSNPLIPVIDLDLLVQNPTSGSLTFYSLAGEASVNGSPTGNVSYFPPSPVAILPNSQTPVQLTIRINDAQMIQDILNYVNSGGGNVNIVITATANINNVPTPVTITFNATP